jgi:hypothetical protein
MNTLREAVEEYLEMRRGLGFKLQEAGKGLIDFIKFLEQHNASTSLRNWRWSGLNNHPTFNRRIWLNG